MAVSAARDVDRGSGHLPAGRVARRRFRPATWPLSVVIAAMLGLAACSGSATPDPNAIKGTFDVGGRSLYLECAGTGGATVVMDSGLGDTHATWKAVVPGLEGVRACTYDRANLGASGAAPKPRSSADVVADLHALLKAAAIAPPVRPRRPLLRGHQRPALRVDLSGRSRRAGARRSDADGVRRERVRHRGSGPVHGPSRRLGSIGESGRARHREERRGDRPGRPASDGAPHRARGHRTPAGGHQGRSHREADRVLLAAGRSEPCRERPGREASRWSRAAIRSRRSIRRPSSRPSSR